jgi:protocatechuate 3,4-dioxygenase beta subunit
MRIAGALLPFAALTLSAAFGQAPAQRQAATDTASPPVAVLLGQVVDADTGQPIADATITLTGRPAPARGRAAAAPASANLFDLMLARGGGAERVASAANGRFTFRGLPASTYTLRAEAPGYVDNPTALRVAGAVASVEIRDKQTSARATLRLWKQAVITGTVVDEAGEPVIGANVRAYRRVVSRFGQLSYDPPDSASTDDRGRYRLFRLDPGDYLVLVPQSHATSPAAAADSAMQSLMSGQMPEGGLGAFRDAGASFMDPRAVRVGEWRLASTNVQSPGATSGAMQAYRTVFYSSAMAATDATWVSLRSGEERGGVDFALQPVVTGRITGVVNGPKGPVGGLPIRLVAASGRLAGDPAALDVATGQTQADGRFTLLAVPPGEYRVIARRDPPADLPADLPEELASNPMMQMALNMQRGAGRVPAYGEATVTVAPGEAPEVAIAVGEGASLSGQVVFEDGQAPVGREVTRVTVALRPLEIALTGARTVRPAADGKLTAAGLLPGRYGVSAALVTPGGAWVVKRVSANGRDATKAALVIEDKPITDLTVVLTRQSGTIRGTVRRDTPPKGDTRSGSAPSLTAVAVPANYTDWQDFELLIDRVYFGGVAQDASFRLGPMLPGEYLVAVVDESQVDPGQGLALVRALAVQATRVTVGPGDANPVTVTVSRLPK